MLNAYFPKDGHADVKLQIIRNEANNTPDAWAKMLEKINNIEFHALPIEGRPRINTLNPMKEGLDYRLFVDAADDIPTKEELANATLEFVVDSRVPPQQKTALLRALPKQLLDAQIIEQAEFVVFDQEITKKFPLAQSLPLSSF